MKRLLQLLLIAAIAFSFNYQVHASAEQSLMGKRDASVGLVETEDGNQIFAGSEAVFSTKGSNLEKIFGKGLPTTLWSHNRRVKCYENAIRVAVQLATIDPHTIADERLNWIAGLLGSSAGNVSTLLDALASVKTGYIKELRPRDIKTNDFYEVLRKASPKSKDGITIKNTNFQKWSTFLTYFDWALTLTNIALGASLEHALFCDAALERLEEIRSALQQYSKNNQIDLAWFEALDRAEQNLIRNESYYGALITSFSDNRSDLAGKGALQGYPWLMKNVFHKNMAHYVRLYLKHQHPGWSTTKINTGASGAAALWTWSIIATYYTIDGLLDQHERAQTATAAATLDYMLQQQVAQAPGAVPKSMKKILIQNQITYYHKMEKVCSGFLTGFNNVTSFLTFQGLPYSAPQKYFKANKEDLEDKLLQQHKTPRLHTGPVPGGRSVLIILDTSSSMNDRLQSTQTRKIDGAKNAILKLLSTTPAPVEWALMVFDRCKSRILVDFTADKSQILNALKGISPKGSTPLAAALNHAGNYLQNHGQYITSDVILLTDGDETCKGNPVAAAKGLFGQSIDFKKWMRP